MFSRIGDATDIVTKEMYDFVDKGGRHVALRPELTAIVCRAFVQHRPPTPWKVWYAGSQLPLREAPARPLPPVRPGRHRGARRRRPVPRRRGDRPRLGVLPPRSGCGRSSCCSTRSASPRIGPATSTRCAATSKPTAARCRRESRETLDKNPLRVLDSKRGRTPPIIAAAPTHRRVLRRRRRRPLRHRARRPRPPRHPVHDRPALVRGLDYYRRTTFEYQGGTLDSAQNALGGGGRYDGLVEALGGPPTPGIGFALGVDRTLLACDDEGVFAAPDDRGRRVRRRHDRRPRGATDHDRAPRRRHQPPTGRTSNRSMKAQMKVADRSGAAVAVIIGGDELAAGTAVVRRYVAVSSARSRAPISCATWSTTRGDRSECRANPLRGARHSGAASR